MIPAASLARDSCSPGIVTDALFPLHLPSPCSSPFPCLCSRSVMCWQCFREEKGIDCGGAHTSRDSTHGTGEGISSIVGLNSGHTQNTRHRLGGANNFIRKCPAAGNVPETFLLDNRADLSLGIFPEIQWLQWHRAGWE